MAHLKCDLQYQEQLLASNKISRRRFIQTLSAAGITLSAAVSLAASTRAIAQTQRFNTQNLKDSYDYIICGAGSAGCVVAAQLAKHRPDASVLLVEAGGSGDSAGVLDMLWFKIYQDPALFWLFKGKAEPFLNGQEPPLPMGRAVGGGSAVNALIYARGHKADYDGWATQLGDKKWSYENVVKIFREIEDYNGPKSMLRGTGGLFYSELQTNRAGMADDLISAGPRVGIPCVQDINAETMERRAGIGPSNIISKDGHRHNVARSFLYPVLSQANITVLTQAYVQNLVMDGTRASGINVQWQGSSRKISATKRVILSTGALKTPQLLMLAGIGPAADLQKVGIKSLIDLPGVGENFHDHPLVGSCAWESPYDFGPTGNGSQCVYFSNVNDKAEAPDLMPVQMQIPFVAEAHAKKPGVPTSNLWVIVPGLAKPRSRGKISLASTQIADAPIVETRFLSERHDLDTLALGVEQARELGNSPEMRKHIKREVLPGPTNRKELEEFVRYGCGTYYHMCGTAKMGQASDPMAVVDSNLSVRGIENLSIADTSVFPDIPRANTMVPAVMVGYQLARILLAQ